MRISIETLMQLAEYDNVSNRAMEYLFEFESAELHEVAEINVKVDRDKIKLYISVMSEEFPKGYSLMF